ncbi:regulator of protease activity HflC (stomatin/prohibitin superfamily) [Paraburkholderia fungorum]|uniref:slipin family protein n=1 Tax=Paraburkholderia fungorum TaxID=134537 RepID=UPI00161C150C|nr:slipin family protein [Paraburkholderia fungorum]MBB4517261.1 regulator of protease activity HflC (stomatin/prohibitin superfamily) [Paraburkholderia fungorum]
MAIIVCLVNSLRVVGQFERGVVLTLGKFSHVAEPGLTILVPMLQSMTKVDVRITATNIKPQDVITSDNVSVKVDAITYYQVTDARKALLDLRDYEGAISQLAQITLRSTIGQHKLDELLSQQAKLNDALRATIEERSKEWGIRVDHVEIRSVDLDATMIRAMAQEAEAERGRRARVITASGEFEAAQKLSEAADILAKNPAAITLRTLATLKEIGAEQNSVIIFPVAQETLLPTNSSGLGAAAIAKALADQMGHASRPSTPAAQNAAQAAS